MLASKRWTVEVHIDEHEGRTRALARLHHRDGSSHKLPTSRCT